LYGITFLGGAHDSGCVFSMDSNGSNYKDIFDFTGTNGSGPEGSLIKSGKMLFGITSAGGLHHYGCIFSVDTSGGRYSDLYDFSGLNPLPTNSSLLLTRNKLYCVTYYGGTHDSGSIFSIDTNGSAYTDIFDFNGTNGAYPACPLTLSRNLLFGATDGGGANHFGCLFVVDSNGNGYKDLLDFNNMSNPEGAYPGNLILSGSALYGMAYSGGSKDLGVVFSFDTNGTTAIINLASVKGIINLYPNPNNGSFRITFNLSTVLEAQTRIEIYNVLGEMVYKSTIAQGTTQIALPNPVIGVYLYKIIEMDGKELGEGKFVVE
jgi:uncharacterized repeat protein (TIGR03803 family)